MSGTALCASTCPIRIRPQHAAPNRCASPLSEPPCSIWASIRFEGPCKHDGSTVQGHLAETRITVLPSVLGVFGAEELESNRRGYQRQLHSAQRRRHRPGSLSTVSWDPPAPAPSLQHLFLNFIGAFQDLEGGPESPSKEEMPHSPTTSCRCSRRRTPSATSTIPSPKRRLVARLSIPARMPLTVVSPRSSTRSLAKRRTIRGRRLLSRAMSPPL